MADQDRTSARGTDGKSAEAFRTITEVANLLELPQHVLRFWETKFPQIKPLKRGGGRRYYRPEDIDLLREIRGLLYDDGYTIKGVQKLLRQNGGKPPSAAPPRPRDEVPAPPARVAAVDLPGSLRRELEGVLNELEILKKLLAEAAGGKS
ncbi:MAG: MerR family transcriptional regulator [Hyphomicrobiales bacterium]|nr:MerR family transcriptional regulator [Hyphomicrobiales bacterium]